MDDTGWGRGRRIGPVAGAVVVLVATCVAAPSASAQPVLPAARVRQWTALQPGGVITAVLADTGNHQVYVVGTGVGEHSRDIAVVAYSGAGLLQWSTFFSDGATDQPYAAAVDPVDHQVYVTGSSSIRDEGDILTVAYGADGQQRWATTWGGVAGSAGGTDDAGQSVAVDPGTHRVFVTGFGGSRNGRVATVAYDADGTQAWEATYTGNGKVAAAGRSVAVDPVSHDVVVGGSSATPASTSTTRHGLTLGYDADGRQRWVDRVEPTAAESGEIAAVAVDPGTHAVYATGSSGTTMVTLGDDGDGRRTWTRWYAQAGTAGEILLVDPGTHRVDVVAQGPAAATGEREFVTVQYTPDGTVQWRRNFGGAGTTPADSYPLAAALDPVSHAVYVTGASTAPGQDYDVATIGYDQAGTRLWTSRYGGTGPDRGMGVAVDPGHGVYVASVSVRPHSLLWTTVSY